MINFIIINNNNNIFATDNIRKNNHEREKKTLMIIKMNDYSHLSAYSICITACVSIFLLFHTFLAASCEFNAILFIRLFIILPRLIPDFIVFCYFKSCVEASRPV